MNPHTAAELLSVVIQSWPMKPTLPRATSLALKSRAYLLAVLTLQVAHLLAILCSSKPAVNSNLIESLVPFVAATVCFRKVVTSTDSAGRTRWLATGGSFCTWSLAQIWFILGTYHLNSRWTYLHIDDALWVLFGLPLLLANYINGQEKTDKIQLLDRAQATLFFTVLYLLVFLPSIKLPFGVAFNIQDSALVLCGLLRLPSCHSESERRFYIQLNIFLMFYGVCMFGGHALYAEGWQDGSLADLVWTIPFTLFSTLVLGAELWPSTRKETGRLVSAAKSIHGLGITVLAISSLGVSAVLTLHHLRSGAPIGVLAFSLFAFRMNARERAWERAHCNLEKVVLQDTLTGLGNRVMLRKCLAERLTQSCEEGVVLLFIDLDRFKGINDSLGHSMGDRLLIEVGAKLSRAVPPDALVCRIGGDEFIVLTSASDSAGAQGVGLAVLEELHSPVLIGAHTLRCTASIGVVLAKAGASAEDLLRTADHAMYHAKQSGKNRVQLFDDSLFLSLNKRWEMEADLREAVETEAITISYRPIARLRDGSIIGVEALARWSHPKWGEVPPSEFIPLAEEAGLILQLGSQVLAKSCRQIAEWNRAWRTTLSVNVNVSPRQLANPGLLQEIVTALERACLDPSLLRIEITETALLVNENAVKQVLTDARSHGIRVALDDFGTGYSSLSYLIDLPVDVVKVDRSFVSALQHDPRRREVVRSIIQLAQSLDKRVVCEGVETEQDLVELLRMECESVQGWIISRPLVASVFEERCSAIEAQFADRMVELRGSVPTNSEVEEDQASCLGGSVAVTR